jgi:uncharacterized membrane protein
MENLVVAKFESLEKANEALSKLQDLDQLGDIVIYNIVLIHADADKTFSIMYHEGPDTIDLPPKGAIAGGLLGLIAGPIGLVVGILTGLIAGTASENNTEIFQKEVLQRVNNHLEEGECAIIMDVEEDSSFVVDSYIGDLSGEMMRTELTNACEKFNRKQRQEFDDEIKIEEKRLKSAGEKDKLAIKNKINDLKIKREERRKRFQTKMHDSTKQIREKIVQLDRKMQVERGERKERLSAHIEQLEKKLNKWNEEVASVFL